MRSWMHHGRYRDDLDELDATNKDLNRRNCLYKRGIDTAEFSTKAKAFIRSHIQSVWQLELLLVFKNGGRDLSIAEASRTLYMEPLPVERGINQFVAAGILTRGPDDKFKYSPNLSVRSAIDELADVYHERRTSVINFIYSSPIQNFADAFKLKQGEED